MPGTAVSVVNSYAAASLAVPVSFVSSVDLPTDGKPVQQRRAVLLCASPHNPASRRSLQSSQAPASTVQGALPIPRAQMPRSVTCICAAVRPHACRWRAARTDEADAGVADLVHVKAAALAAAAAAHWLEQLLLQLCDLGLCGSGGASCMGRAAGSHAVAIIELQDCQAVRADPAFILSLTLPGAA
jgi:hypothetical protein